MTVLLTLTYTTGRKHNRFFRGVRGVPEPYQAGSPMPGAELFWRDYWHDMGRAYRPGRVA